MEQRTLTATERKRLGKEESGRLRRTGMIPAVMYGRREPKSIAVDEHEFNIKFHTVSESTIIKLKLGETDHEVLIRDFQEDMISGRITHIDFYEVEKGKILRTNVSLHLIGTAVGVREGGLLETFVHEVEVECLPRDLPEKIEVEISDLKLGHSVHIRELPPREGVKILNSSDQVVCTIVHKRLEEKPAAVEEEAPAEEEAAEAPTEE